SRRRRPARPAGPEGLLNGNRGTEQTHDRHVVLEGSVRRWTRKIAPPAGSFLTMMRPPWASTIAGLIVKPMPTPSGLVVKNGSKMRPRSASEMPLPESCTPSSTYGGVESDVHTVILGVITSPFAVAAVLALVSRFKSTCCICTGSPYAMGSAGAG